VKLFFFFLLQVRDSQEHADNSDGATTLITSGFTHDYFCTISSDADTEKGK